MASPICLHVFYELIKPHLKQNNKQNWDGSFEKNCEMELGLYSGFIDADCCSLHALIQWVLYLL
jgi:hypothetical protein